MEIGQTLAFVAPWAPFSAISSYRAFDFLSAALLLKGSGPARLIDPAFRARTPQLPARDSVPTAQLPAVFLPIVYRQSFDYRHPGAPRRKSFLLGPASLIKSCWRARPE
jgi:hypothetical protein